MKRVFVGSKSGAIPSNSSGSSRDPKISSGHGDVVQLGVHWSQNCCRAHGPMIIIMSVNTSAN